MKMLAKSQVTKSTTLLGCQSTNPFEGGNRYNLFPDSAQDLLGRPEPTIYSRLQKLSSVHAQVWGRSVGPQRLIWVGAELTCGGAGGADPPGPGTGASRAPGGTGGQGEGVARSPAPPPALREASGRRSRRRSLPLACRRGAQSSQHTLAAGGASAAPARYPIFTRRDPLSPIFPLSTPAPLPAVPYPPW